MEKTWGAGKGRAGRAWYSSSPRNWHYSLSQVPKSHILVSESRPYPPFPSLQTHLRHLSSARPPPSQQRKGGALGPGAFAAVFSVVSLGEEGLLGPLGAKSLLSPLGSFRLTHPWPQHISIWTTKLTPAPEFPPHPILGRGGSGMALHTHSVPSVPPTQAGS